MGSTDRDMIQWMYQVTNVSVVDTCGSFFWSAGVSVLRTVQDVVTSWLEGHPKRLPRIREDKAGHVHARMSACSFMSGGSFMHEFSRTFMSCQFMHAACMFMMSTCHVSCCSHGDNVMIYS